MKIIILMCCLLSLLCFSCDTGEPERLFSEISPKKTGINFKNLVRESEEFNVLTYGQFYNGGGVAVGDINNDGLPDIYFTGNMMASKLYLNKGNLEFEDITETAGVAAAGLWNTGTTMADVNGDGLLDIYICRSAANDPEKRRNLLFINNGDLTFTESAAEYGLDDPGYSTQATFFDFDRDGDLDMFLLNHSTQEYAGFSRINGNFKNRKDKNIGNRLFVNNGDGSFSDVTDSSGITNNVLGFGLAVTVFDADNDGWLDIYVSNDYSEEDYLYINQQDGTFKESLREQFGHVSFFSMGADAGDLNNDGLTDIVTADMLPESSYSQKKILGPEHYDKYKELIDQGFFPQTMRNMLQLNQGNGYFSEIGQLSGISKTDWSWAVLAADYDNDGWKDILITNGYMRNYLDMDFLTYLVNQKISGLHKEKEQALLDVIEKMPPIKIQNYLYRNNGDLTFTNSAVEWGVGGATVSSAAAYADLDNDGDLDLIICHINEVVSIYRNNSETINDNHFLKIRLKGDDKNTFGIGAKIILYSANQSIHQELIPVRGFQSSVNPEFLFGLGKIEEVDSLLVLWPDGRQQSLFQVKADQLLVLNQSDAKHRELVKEVVSPAFFEVKSKLGIDYKHQQGDFLDFRQDRLMPNAVSDSGPKMIKGDYNNDGLDDFYLTGSLGEAGVLYKQLPSGEFLAVPQKHFEEDSAYQDVDAVFFDANGDGFLDLFVVSGGNVYPENSPLYQDRIYINDKKGGFIRKEGALPEMYSSGSSVVSGDFDKDGSVDLFVGGRVIPGSYPLAPRSYLLKNKGNGIFEDVTSDISPELLHPGMITDARFCDLDGDGWDDLVVVGEWMKITVYFNNKGESFTARNDAFPTNTTGWWNTIQVVDVDQDGDLDLIVGNFGLNNPYQPSDSQPISLVFNDFDKNGSIDPLMQYYIADTLAFAYSRDELIGQIPSLKKRFPDYETFAKASPSEFFTEDQIAGTDTLKAVMLGSAVFLNDGKGNFTAKELPIEAQFAPIHALLLIDINGDGHLDLLTGGNASNGRVSSGPSTANYGMIFLGDGQGAFSLFDPRHSGIKIKGDIRDINEFDTEQGQFILYTVNNQEVKVYQKQVQD